MKSEIVGFFSLQETTKLLTMKKDATKEQNSN